MKIAVVYVAMSEAGWASHSPGKSPAATYLSHALSCLSAKLKNIGHAPYLVDGRSFNSPEHFSQVAKGLEFDVALVWVMPLSRDVAAEAIAAMRAAGKTQPIVAAGPGVSSSGERLANETCDLLGEIDESFPALLAKFSANATKIPGTIADGLEKPVADVDGLPEIDRGHFNVEIEKASVPLHLLAPPIYTLTVGRGCPACHDATMMGVSFRCARCWSGEGEPKYAFRARDPRRWVDDVYRLTGSHGTGGVGSIVVHDSHLVDLAWLTAMAADWRDMVRRVRLFLPLDPRVINSDPSIVRELAKCGMTWAHFDVGHGSDRLRRVLGVPFAREEAVAAAEALKRNRVNLAVRILSGLPGETEDDMNATERFMRELAPTKIDASVWRPCPGTALWIDANRLALISNDGTAGDGAPRPHVKGYDYARGTRRLLLWPPAYESKIVDLPADQWMAPPPMPAPSAPKTKNGVPVGVVAQPAPAALAVPTPSGKTPTRDDWDAVLARCEEVRAQSAGTHPKVTVITAVHSKLEFLREALGSIEAQTLRENYLIEHIIIDDASTREDLREYLSYKNTAEFPNWRPRVIRFPQNVNNIAVSWNVALSVARGEYVCFLDADNRRLPTFLERLIGELEANESIDVAHCKSHIIDAHGNRTSIRGRAKAKIALAEETEGNWVDSGEMVIRRSALARVGVFDERMKACEDWDLVTRLIKCGCKFKFVDEPLCEYRTHAAQRMHTSQDLGAGRCADLIRDKANRRNEWDVRIVTPPPAALTASQRQVIAGISDSLKAVEWVRLIDDDGGPGFACDVALVVAPFRLGDVDIEALFRRVDNHGGPRRPQVVSVHMEDPQAVVANGRLLGRADWVVANDYSAMRHYRAKLAESGLTERARRVMCWNALGASPRYLRAVEEAVTDPKHRRDIDVLVLGYAYPSRQAIVKAFVKDAPTSWKVACVGDGWAEAMRGMKVECQPTASEDATARWCARAKAILVTHRRQQDIGGFPLFEPESIHRGFLESAAGAVVLCDDVRTFGAGGVEFVRYSDGRDAAKKAFGVLAKPKALAALADKNSALARGDLSMASRVRAIMNAIRDERYGVVIP